VACLTTVMVIASPAHATDTFAQFVQLFPNARIFTYTNTNGGIKAKLGTLNGSDAVFVSDLGTLVSPSIAVVNLTATAAGLPTVVGTNIEQHFSGSLTFTLLAPQWGMSGWSTNALKVTFTDALFEAASGGGASTLQANSGSGSTISYMSDFADLTGATDEDFALSFSGASTTLVMVGSRLPNFRISGTGTFAAALPTPEPASWSMMVGGFGLMGAMMRSRRGRTSFSTDAQPWSRGGLTSTRATSRATVATRNAGMVRHTDE
jgi:hypothetical protein